MRFLRLSCNFRRNVNAYKSPPIIALDIIHIAEHNVFR